MMRNTLVFSMFLAVAANGIAAGSLRAARPTDGPAARGALTMIAPEHDLFAVAFDSAVASNDLRSSLRVVSDGARPAPETLTNEHNERQQTSVDTAAAASELRELIAQTGASAATLARKLGIRPAVITLLLEDPERIPAEHRGDLVGRVREMLRRQLAAKRAAAAGYVRTGPVAMIAGVARTVAATHTIGLVAGGSGFGKSVGMRAIEAELPGHVVALRATTDSRSAKGLMRAVGVAAGDGNSAVQPSIRRGIELTKAAALMVIDEAQLLSGSALEAARALHDVGGVGVLLIGTRALGGAVAIEADPACAPLAARVAVQLDLDREFLTPGPSGRSSAWLSRAELAAILATAVPDTELDDDAIGLLCDVANHEPGHIRRAVLAAKIARVLASADGATPVRIGIDDARSGLTAGRGVR